MEIAGRLFGSELGFQYLF